MHIHRNKLHTLEGERGVDENAEDTQETIEADVVRRQVRAGKGTRGVPVLNTCPQNSVTYPPSRERVTHANFTYPEANALVVGASSKIDHETGDDEDGDQTHYGIQIEPRKGIMRRLGGHLHLMIEKTNSDSPNHLTPKMLMREVAMQMATM